MTSDSLHTERPTVYLDEWAWVHLANAAAGKPSPHADAKTVQALLRAAEAGVAFPISATTYIETWKERNVARRWRLAEFIAAVSHCRTLASRRVLLTDQLLVAMHDTFSRPFFPPKVRDALGLGMHWAFIGKLQMCGPFGPDSTPELRERLFPGDTLRRTNQWLQLRALAGPADEEIERLRAQYQYRPEAAEETTRSRVEFETIFEGIVKEAALSSDELRFRVQLRELIHELAQLVGTTFREYGLPLDRLVFGAPDVPGRRAVTSAFLDSMPSVRVAVDLKKGLFYDNDRPIKGNDLRDIDAMSFAVPYCHVVVADKATVDALGRVDAAGRFGTVITKRIRDVLEHLPRLEAAASTLDGPSGWDTVGPGIGFRPLSPDKRCSAS